MAIGFTLAFYLPARAANEPEQARDTIDGKFAPNAFIRIDHSGKTTLVMPQVEMGQGVYTAIPMILAEELDADFSKVEVEHAPPNEMLYANPMLGVQATGNSNSIRAFWKPLRQAGATTRAMLVQAAAERWQVNPASCTAANSVITHAASGRSLAYGDLIDAAAALAVPQDPPLKDPKDFTLIGKPLKRLDTPHKTNGSAIYGIDTMLPGMKFATLAACPVFGGKVAKVDDSDTKAVPGVREIIVLDDLVAVVGDHMCDRKKPRRTYDHLGRRPQLQDQFRAQISEVPRSVSKKNSCAARSSSATSQRDWRRAKESTPNMRCRIPRARDHGADELHGARDAGLM